MGKIILFIASLLYFISIKAENLISLKVPYKNNKTIDFALRVPEKFHSEKDKKYRLISYINSADFTAKQAYDSIFLFNPVSMKEYQTEIKKTKQFLDAENIFFLFPPTNIPDYWLPEVGTGESFMNAVKKVKEIYPINDKEIIFIGESAGGRAANLFAEKYSNYCAAWVAYGSRLWHKPNEKMKYIPGFIGCGSNDRQTLIQTKKFIKETNSLYKNLIFKIFPNEDHAPTMESYKLIFGTVKYFHLKTAINLNRKHKKIIWHQNYIGDADENYFYPADHLAVQYIKNEYRVKLPDKKYALLWGVPAPFLQKGNLK